MLRGQRSAQHRFRKGRLRIQMVSQTTQTVSAAAQLKIIPLIAKELGVGPSQVQAAVALLDEGSTVPFIARYRKEVTGNLDDTHLQIGRAHV